MLDYVLCVQVLFQNDSPATLLAQVVGIISPINQEMLAKGKDTYKYFTKNHMLYERNQESNRLELVQQRMIFHLVPYITTYQPLLSLCRYILGAFGALHIERYARFPATRDYASASGTLQQQRLVAAS
nr:dual specificity tyrosine-phosphorylation-regulated kinase 3 [Ipomoea batatas]